MAQGKHVTVSAKYITFTHDGRGTTECNEVNFNQTFQSRWIAENNTISS